MDSARPGFFLLPKGLAEAEARVFQAHLASLQVSFETRGLSGYAKGSLVLVLEWISVHLASNSTQRSRLEREKPRGDGGLWLWKFSVPSKTGEVHRGRSAGRKVDVGGGGAAPVFLCFTSQEVWPTSGGVGEDGAGNGTPLPQHPSLPY